jgi:hypothetical protein
MVLCETSIFGSSPTTKRHANILADGLLKGYDGQGGGYNGAGDDFSVSGWVALGLKSAIQAQLPIMQDEAKIDKLFKVYGDWVNKMTDPETGDGFYRPDKKGSTALSWVGMFQKQFLGFPRHDPFLKKAAAVGMKNAAKTMGRDKNKKLMWKDEYGLYYGTLAAFQQQGKFWKMWNPLMLEVLLGTQEQEKTSDNYGSWTPSHKHIGERGGRVMSTALLTLCLEVYYRYALMQ